jgi:site-specific DNA-methyltransferase (adenine-specific)
MNRGWDKSGIAYDSEVWRQALRVLRPGGYLLAFGGTRTFHRLGVAIEDAGWEYRDTLSWLYGSGFPKSLDVSKAIDAPATPEAAEWEGWGTALKPAWEPIILARKPFKGTVASNVLAHGTGALNIDATRIAGDNPSIARRQGAINHLSTRSAAEAEAEGRIESRQSPESFRAERAGEALGRWPANVALDEEAAALLDAQSGERPTGDLRGNRTWEGFAPGEDGGERTRMLMTRLGDSGGASRFYYTAKASRAERERGLEDMPEIRRSDGREKDIENPRLRTSSRKNDHPTVKPIALMRWLVRMVTPPEGVVLDPFMGSGSTGIAVREEGFRFVGIDIDAHYCEIAKRRIAATSPDAAIETVVDKSSAGQ